MGGVAISLLRQVNRVVIFLVYSTISTVRVLVPLPLCVHRYRVLNEYFNTFPLGVRCTISTMRTSTLLPPRVHLYQFHCVYICTIIIPQHCACICIASMVHLYHVHCGYICTPPPCVHLHHYYNTVCTSRPLPLCVYLYHFHRAYICTPPKGVHLDEFTMCLLVPLLSP